MKRSDMILEIRSLLKEVELENSSDLDLAAEQLLKLVEEHGMLPPNVCWLTTGEYGPVRVLAKLATSDYDCSICWEEE